MSYYRLIVTLFLNGSVTLLLAVSIAAQKTCTESANSIRNGDFHVYRRYETVHEWKYLDFEYPTYQSRQLAIANGDFVPENNLPLGIDVHGQRLFITTPRWKDGVPASLSTVHYPSTELSPSLRPYPNWSAHSDTRNPDCKKLVSVYRTFIDDCQRLWLIDSGIINATVNLRQLCPPKIVVYDLSNDRQLRQYELPAIQVKEDSLHSNIVVELVNNQCHDAHAYVTDVWRYGLIVYSLAKGRSWRITNHNFLPTPQATNFQLYNLKFHWPDGVFGMSLTAFTPTTKERFLFFHPMASYKEFIVPTSLLRDEDVWSKGSADVGDYFQMLGDRGEGGQSSSSSLSREGVMLFTQVHKDTIACWDTNKPYQRSNILHLRDSGNVDPNGAEERFSVDGGNGNRLIFPNDLKVRDNWREEEAVWVMCNRLPIYLYSKLNYSEINFRLMTANLKYLIEGTTCDRKSMAGGDSLTLSTKTVNEGECY